MRFSIIIPVYNVEKYIRKCMESIMNQTFRDFEVIVVDDESPDNSMRIVEAFAEKFPGVITMIHQKNTRQGGARNRGVREAKGEYLIFVDSDDYVGLKMLETLDAKLRETPCDILMFQNMEVTEDGENIRLGYLGGLAPGVYSPQKDKELMMVHCVPWGKVFLRSFYLESRVEFPEKILYEDTILRVLYAKASKIVVCDDCFYYYVQSRNSSIRQKPSERMLDILTMSDMVVERFRKEGLYESFRAQLEASMVGSIIYILDVINDADWKSPLQDRMVDYINAQFPNCEENPYLDEDIRGTITLLKEKNFRRYHARVSIPRRIKNRLRRWPALVKLNQLRKKVLQKKG